MSKTQTPASKTALAAPRTVRFRPDQDAVIESLPNYNEVLREAFDLWRKLNTPIPAPKAQKGA